MTPEERSAIQILRRCTFVPGSWDKRFVRDMAAKLDAELEHEENTVNLSERQHECLVSKIHRYRRQHGKCKCLECLKAAMGKDNPHQLTMFGESREGRS